MIRAIEKEKGVHLNSFRIHNEIVNYRIPSCSSQIPLPCLRACFIYYWISLLFAWVCGFRFLHVSTLLLKPSFINSAEHNERQRTRFLTRGVLCIAYRCIMYAWNFLRTVFPYLHVHSILSLRTCPFFFRIQFRICATSSSRRTIMRNYALIGLFSS